MGFIECFKIFIWLCFVVFLVLNNKYIYVVEGEGGFCFFKIFKMGEFCGM